jgi:hypothetical protein
LEFLISKHLNRLRACLIVVEEWALILCAIFLL